MAQEPTTIAAQAGLRYLSDDRPGIVRRRRGRGFSYTGPRGGVVPGAVRERIRTLAVPPAWESVWIAPEEDAHLQATGVDVAGRKQYLYHPAWRESADEAKYQRLTAFAPALERLRQRVDHDLRARNDELLCATIVRLIDRCLVRPGGRRRLPGSEAVGATGFGCDDVAIRRGVIVLDFVGKAGVDHHIEVRDRQLARVVSDLLDSSTGSDALFSSAAGDTVDERRLNSYIGDATRSGFTAKDFRTWGATATVAGELGPIDPRVRADLDACKRAAIEVAADALGNTPAVCRSSYVAPAVLDAFESGTLATCWRSSRKGIWLSRAERALAKLFDDVT